MSNAQGNPLQRRWLNIALWAAQIVIFVIFVWAAYLKIVVPIPDLAKMWEWAGQFPKPMVRIIGIIDLLGGIGIILPWLTRIRRELTVAAAVGCAALQSCAIVFHISRGEISVVPINIVLLCLAIFVFVGRRRDFRKTTRRNECFGV